MAAMQCIGFVRTNTGKSISNDWMFLALMDALKLTRDIKSVIYVIDVTIPRSCAIHVQRTYCGELSPLMTNLHAHSILLPLLHARLPQHIKGLRSSSDWTLCCYPFRDSPQKANIFAYSVRKSDVFSRSKRLASFPSGIGVFARVLERRVTITKSIKSPISSGANEMADLMLAALATASINYPNHRVPRCEGGTCFSNTCCSHYHQGLRSPELFTPENTGARLNDEPLISTSW